MGCTSSSQFGNLEPDVYVYARNGDVDKLRKALQDEKQKPGLDYLDSDGLTALAVAASAGHHECLKVLLSVSGINLNRKSTRLGGQTPGKTPTKTNDELRTPTKTSIHMDRYSTPRGFNLFSPSKNNFRSPSEKSVFSERGGGLVYANDEMLEASTAVSLAAVEGHTECVKLLLAAGAEVRTYAGGITLIMVAFHGYKDCLNLLIEAGVNVNAQGGTGNTALMASAYGGHEDCVVSLLNAGADINHRNMEKKSAADIASEEGHVAIADLINSYIDTKA
mmetsp:Transcript_14402/g.19736  ORF Transcript_14402/g.19736 Transcript_14402/m.19736 type:complete len:278 (+) Transcript_14402:65-898(+)